MYKIMLCYLSVICLVSCKPTKNNHEIPANKKSRLVIINQTKNKNEQFKYFDYFGTSQLTPFPQTDTLCVEYSHPIVTYITNSPDFSDLTYYTLSSSDTIYLKIKEGKQMLFSNNKILENKIKLMSMLLFNVGSMNYSTKADYETAKTAIDNFYLKKKSVVSLNKNDLDSKTIREADDMVNYDKLASVVALNTQFNKKGETTLTGLKIRDLNAWNYLTFRNLVFNCNRYVNKVYHINSPVAVINYIKEKYPASMREDAIFSYLNNYKPLSKDKLDTLNRLVKEFSTYAIHRDFATTLKTNLAKYNDNFKAQDSKAIELLPTNSNKPVNLNQLIAQNVGKLLFIDIWASWCAPCLREMQSSSALAKMYKGKNAPIVFLYLSKDENMSAWENKSKELQLSENQSFIVLKNKSFLQFENKYAIKAIPRYLIIGKKGEMIDPDALQPSNPLLKVLLDDLLKDVSL